MARNWLQICLVYINTLMIQRVLTEPDWGDDTKVSELSGSGESKLDNFKAFSVNSR